MYHINFTRILVLNRTQITRVYQGFFTHMDKKYSIIIPVYNSERYVGKCLDSVLQQTFSEYEIVIIDDGSEDNSWNIINQCQIKDDRIISIHQENQGVAIARNTGLDIASGKYILFVDSDDYVSDELLSTLNRYIDNYNPDILEYGVYETDTLGKTIQKQSLRDEYIQDDTDCLTYYYEGKNTRNYCWDKVFRRELIENLRFKIFSHSEDYVFNVELFLKAKSVKTISDCLYYYRVHEESTVHSPFSKRKLDIIRAGEVVYNFLEQPRHKLYALDYILNNSINLYFQIMIDNTIQKEKYSKYFVQKYSIYYKQLRRNTKYRHFSVQRKIKFLLFKISPRLYRFVMSLYHRVKKPFDVNYSKRQ